MWTRLPWMKSRAGLFGLAIADALVLGLIYNIRYHAISNRWVGLTGSITMAIMGWLSISYLVGRYSNKAQSKKKTALKILGYTILAAGILLITTVLAGWIFNNDDLRIERSFLFPVVLTTSLVSATLQIILRRCKEITSKWLLIGTQAEIDVISHELLISNGANSLEVQFLVDSATTEELLNTLPNHYGLGISDSARLPDRAIETLLTKRSKGSEIQDLVSWAEQNLQRVPPEIFTPRWLVQADGFRLQPNRTSWRLKRLGDLAIGILLIVISSPIIVIAAIAIRLNDGGPVFYRQIRTGLYGKSFLIRKLRTMRVDAESSGAQWSHRKDERITSIGQWLRRTRVDELPQLFNVISGEMSLIGPRPERPVIEEELEVLIPHYRIRHWIRPGLSGWAQVCYNYGASITDSRAKLSYDLYYLRNANILLDMLILIKTIRLIALAKGSTPASLHRSTA
jgi:exopolysaccharide biosynthesis polyprenyl glycosylphosphotransferase